MFVFSGDVNTTKQIYLKVAFKSCFVLHQAHFLLFKNNRDQMYTLDQSTWNIFSATVVHADI